MSTIHWPLPGTATWNGTNIATTANPTYTITASNTSSVYTPVSATPDGGLDLRGEKADIKINGVSLCDTLAGIQERLNLLVPNPELEKEWEELAELGEQYKQLEDKIKLKIEMGRLLTQDWKS